MGKKMKLDFSGVEAYVKCAEGRHLVKLTAIEETESQAGNDMLNATFKVVKGQSTGATLYDNFVLTEKALWKLQSFLIAVGMKADGKVVLDLDKIIGKTCFVDVEHEEYEGKTRARIQDFIAPGKDKPSDDDEDIDDEDTEDLDEEDEEPAPKKKPKAGKKTSPDAKPGKKKPKPVDDDEDDDWGDDEDWDDED